MSERPQEYHMDENGEDLPSLLRRLGASPEPPPGTQPINHAAAHLFPPVYLRGAEGDTYSVPSQPADPAIYELADGPLAGYYARIKVVALAAGSEN